MELAAWDVALLRLIPGSLKNLLSIGSIWVYPVRLDITMLIACSKVKHIREIPNMITWFDKKATGDCDASI